MSRKLSFVLLLTLAAGFASGQQEVEKKQIGIQLWSVRDALKDDVPGTIEQLGQIGYSFVEAAGYNDGQFYGMEPTEFKALLEKNGMTMKGSHAGINLPKEGEWDSAMNWWDQCIAAHKAAGAEWIVKPSMGDEAYRSLETLQRYCDYYNAIGEKCNAAGIQFGYHNHAHEFETKLDGQLFYDYLLQHTDPDKVMFELDLYWIKEGGKEALDYFKQYPGRFELYHVKDETELGGKDATMDFKPLFEASRQAGMKNYIVEVERYHYDPMESVRMSYDFLNQAEYTH
ncbi:sugar phosphate isomerase/epimerase family protein [Mangrovibacterium lignilyticum]|uniref:sugar phosphate isomerase/epimerase family protein n=1 Tax=Mangrovibacterium lignilyticum TaxID=2668052 RepID=UPI0013D01BF1|nr:sugar phosphate isomerase/epimerase [Mangrovibacterium lignilyticum]